MLEDYKEILEIARASGKQPVWWDIHGVPRFCDPPKKYLPYMRWIRCQECHAKFWVCLCGPYRHLYDDTQTHYMLIRTGQVSEDQPVPIEWFYGDPPFHGNGHLGPHDKCAAGYCMSSECEDELTEEQQKWDAQEWE